MTTYRLTTWIPGHVPSTANLREFWAKRAKRTKLQRYWAYTLLSGQVVPWDTAVVTLERWSPRPLDDDNNVSACKNFRDGVADALGIKDNNPRVVWRYQQHKSKDKGLFIEIDLEGR